MSVISIRSITCLLAFVAAALQGCSTAPRASRQPEFISDSRMRTAWFEQSVNGLSAQIEQSSGFIIFPDVAQFGMLIGGGTFGRGAVCAPDGRQLGWAALNTGSVGLQAGVQGFRMLVVLQDDQTLQNFMANRWSGGASGVVVAGDVGGSAKVPFENGVAIYEGANRGLMAGVRIGLDYIRFEPLKSSEITGDVR